MFGSLGWEMGEHLALWLQIFNQHFQPLPCPAPNIRFQVLGAQALCVSWLTSYQHLGHSCCSLLQQLLFLRLFFFFLHSKNLLRSFFCYCHLFSSLCSCSSGSISLKNSFIGGFPEEEEIEASGKFPMLIQKCPLWHF